MTAITTKGWESHLWCLRTWNKGEQGGLPVGGGCVVNRKHLPFGASMELQTIGLSTCNDTCHLLSTYYPLYINAKSGPMLPNR